MVAPILMAMVLSSPTGREARLSSAVALVSSDPVISEFLTRPTRSVMEAHFRFESDLGEDVIFGIDQEFIEGVRRPLFQRGGDWMGLIGLQRTGTVWIATGTAETHKGIPSKDRNWVIRSLGRPLKPGIWYRITTEVDVAKREFVSLRVEGDGWDQQMPLTGLTLDYPNEMPFSDRAMGYFVFAMRGRSMMKGGAARVQFDDVKAWVIAANSSRQSVLTSDFESTDSVRPQPVTAPTIDLKGYRQGGWYLEREDALISIERTRSARSGSKVLVADAKLD